MIRVAIVDDHHAVRLGLGVAIQSEPGLVPAGVAATAAELAPLLYRTRPDVVLLDYSLPDADGLTVCRYIKSQVPAPGVILYSAFADGSMTVPAIVAGADGILNKGVPARELFEAIREVAGGGDALPAISNEMLEVASLALDDEDLPILGMLIDRTPPADIAQTLRLDPPALRWRIRRMLGRLQASVGRVRHPLDVRGDESRPVWLDSPREPGDRT
jgi:DNA-binding NarL/FixJ family response regulator